MDCSKIALGLVAANCASAELPGTGSSVFLMSYSDIDRENSTVGSITANIDGVSATLTNIISAIALKAGTFAYVFESLEDSHVGEIALSKGSYYSEFDHVLSLRVFVKTEGAKAFVNQLKGARVVCVPQAKAKDTHTNCGPLSDQTWSLGEYEAYGWDAGLVVTEVTASTEMPDKTVYTIKLASSDLSKEQTLPKAVFNTTAGTGLTMLNALVEP